MSGLQRSTAAPWKQTRSSEARRISANPLIALSLDPFLFHLEIHNIGLKNVEVKTLIAKSLWDRLTTTSFRIYLGAWQRRDHIRKAIKELGQGHELLPSKRPR